MTTTMPQNFPVDLLPLVLWTARPDGSLCWANARWHLWTGMRPEQLDWGWSELLPAEHREPFRHAWRQSVNTGEPLDIELPLRRADGSRCWHRISAVAERDESGRIVRWCGACADIERQRRSDQAALQLAAIAESSEDAILSRDLDGIITGWNAAAERIFGYRAHEAVGKHISLIVPEHRSAELREIYRRLLSGQRVDPIETERITKDGRHLRISLAVSPIRDGRERIVGFSTIGRDITARKQAEQELKQAKDAAEAANRAKDRFIAIISHELRTPLTPVLAAATALEARKSLPPDVAADLAMIRRSVELEARLIDDLLDLTRLRGRRMELHLATIDAHMALRSAVELCRGDIDDKRIELLIDLAAAAHTVRADIGRLQQAFWNLICNAVKFTPRNGRITLRTRDGRKAGGQEPQPMLVVEVEDTGVGIQSHRLSGIFNAFEHVGDPSARPLGGVGVGLAIARAIVELHGGEIEAASQGAGQGATFAVRLPAIPALPADACAGGGAIAPLRVLLVEDHDVSRDVVARLLRGMGHAVTAVRDVQSAIREASVGDFDLLVSDLGLPDGTGHELMRRITAQRPIRGICVSGFGTEDDIRRSHEAGFAAHIVKPMTFETLEQTIHQFHGRD